MVFRAKLRQNAENTCALLTMANNGLAATLTNDQGKLHSVLSRVEPGGEIKVIFMVSIRVEFIRIVWSRYPNRSIISQTSDEQAP